jgi:hypothetical protein
MKNEDEIQTGKEKVISGKIGTKNVLKSVSPGRMGFIRSSLRNPVSVSYNGEGMIIAPQGRVDNVDKERLGALCTGVKFVPYCCEKV